MNTLATISSGNLDTADVFFLLAVIAAALATAAAAAGTRTPAPPWAKWWATLLALAVTLAALAWLVL